VILTNCLHWLTSWDEQLTAINDYTQSLSFHEARQTN